MQTGDPLREEQESLNKFLFLASQCILIYSALGASPNLNKSSCIYFATVCSDEVESVILIDEDERPIKPETWCLDCIVQIFISGRIFIVAEMIFNENIAAYNARKTDQKKPPVI